jgi:hypothetical protein
MFYLSENFGIDTRPYNWFIKIKWKGKWRDDDVFFDSLAQAISYLGQFHEFAGHDMEKHQACICQNLGIKNTPEGYSARNLTKAKFPGFTKKVNPRSLENLRHGSKKNNKSKGDSIG